ncbi:MAG TPA: SpoIIE family protein phosphatase [Streptosporangiaceae bacterium]|nr:SpoIIE family protein phosphatase [Streptosporangiaceae bacterium]
MPVPGEPGEMAPRPLAREASLPAQAWLGLGASTELADIAGQLLDLTVPQLADAAGVYAYEPMLAGGAHASVSGELVLRRIGIRVIRDVPLMDAAFPPGEVVAFSTGSPYGQCAASGDPAMFAQPDGRTLERVGPETREVLARYRAFMAVPMTAGDTIAGMLICARAAGRPAFDDNDALLAAGIAKRAGGCIANACLLRQYKHAAEAIQYALMAAEPVSPADIEVCGRCIPADGLIGGDWYDVVALAPGRVGLVVGDVMGHGIGAAATMGQLRAAARALAELELAPADVLGRLDRTTVALRHSVYATCAYAIIDTVGHYATIALAGHLPPVLAMPDGSTYLPDIPPGLSLGLGITAYGEARVRLPAGATLALFTDGLVETRSRPYDQGIQMMHALLADQRSTLHQACDAIVAALGRGREDDVTLVLARIPPR